MTSNYGPTSSKGIVVFPTLAEAVRYGFHEYERTDDGYVVRTRTSAGWAFALVRGHDG